MVHSQNPYVSCRYIFRAFLHTAYNFTENNNFSAEFENLMKDLIALAMHDNATTLTDVKTQIENFSDQFSDSKIAYIFPVYANALSFDVKDNTVVNALAVELEAFTKGYSPWLQRNVKKIPKAWTYDMGIIGSTTVLQKPFTYINTVSSGNLYLGRIPVYSAKAWFFKKGGAKITELASIKKLALVVSFLEDWAYKHNENVTKVTPNDWYKASISHHWSQIPDNTNAFPIVEFLNALICTYWYLQNGKDVYVHCKSGIGRSATFIIAYLIVLRFLQGIEWGNSDIEKVKIVIQEVQKQRSIVNLQDCQKEFLIGNMCLWRQLAKDIKTGQWKKYIICKCNYEAEGNINVICGSSSSSSSNIELSEF